MMRDELASPHGWYVVVEEAGRIVGYAGLRAVRGARDADIQTIAIAAGSRGRGRGRGLLEALLAEASDRRVHDVFLEVRADNPVAQALYASEGFVEVGRRPRYYQPDDVDAVVMRLDVRGVGRAAGCRCRRSRDRRRRRSVHMNALRQAQGPLVLGIETSCDETGIGIVRGRTLLSNTIASSMDEHARYGGVVPEVAARAHLEALQPSIEAALAEAGVTLADIDAVAVTSGPGLAGALMVGVGAAKALAVSLDRPALRRQPPRRTHRRRHPRRLRPAAGVPDGRAPRQRRAHVAAARPRPDDRRRAARRDHGRRRRRGLRQGRAAARAAVSRGSRDRSGRGIRRSSRDSVPARPLARVGPRQAPLRLLVLGAQDGGRPLDRAAPGRRRAGARRRCRGVVPRGRRRRARDQGARRVRATTTCRDCCSAAESSRTAGCATSRSSERMPRA